MTLSGWTKSITSLFRDEHLPVKKGLAHQSHRPKHLVKLVKRQLSQPRGSWSESKKQAWADLRVWRRSHDSTKECPREQAMRQLVGILDDLLFDGAFGSSVRFEWVWFGEPPHDSSIFLGLTTTSYSAEVQDYVSVIWMHPEPHPPLGLSTGDPEMVLFDTLLHEMCHAYLGLFACRGNLCRQGHDKCSLAVHSSLSQLDGHGQAWKDLDAVVEDAMGRIVGSKTRCGDVEAQLHRVFHAR